MHCAVLCCVSAFDARQLFSLHRSGIRYNISRPTITYCILCFVSMLAQEDRDADDEKNEPLQAPNDDDIMSQLSRASGGSANGTSSGSIINNANDDGSYSNEGSLLSRWSSKYAPGSSPPSSPGSLCTSVLSSPATSSPSTSTSPFDEAQGQYRANQMVAEALAARAKARQDGTPYVAA
jgi:hypothetical protein